MWIRFKVLLLIFMLPHLALANKEYNNADKIADCTGFFDVMSQLESPNSESYFTLASTFSVYAIEVFPKNAMENRILESRSKMAQMIKDLTLSERGEDIGQFIKDCLTVLENTEKDLWQNLPEPSKAMAPKMFVD